MTKIKVGINGVNRMFETLIEEMKLKNFSKKTMEIYLYYNQVFIKYIKKSPREVSGKDIRDYLLYLICKRKSSSTINLIHNALNFYYGNILKKSVKHIPFQKREHKVKQIASKNNIQKMIQVTKNQKHKLIISLLYASGVRRAELVKIKINDLDFGKKLLLVRQGKGNKDRYTILSDLVINQIHTYLMKRPYNSEYLFASQNGHITSSTVEQVIKQARIKAKIKNNLTPHSLRHSFTTHHMESGTKTEYIQEMLGHKDIRTTRGYEKISNRHLMKIKSPHDIF
jgi:integrase/recombinase XerD